MISDWFVAPEHAALIPTISSFHDQGVIMKAVAEALNEHGFLSHSGKAFCIESVGGGCFAECHNVIVSSSFSVFRQSLDLLKN